MKTYANLYPQSALINWHIWSILLCTAALVALTGFTSHIDGASPAPTSESAKAGDPSDPANPVPDASPAMKCAQCGVVSALREIVATTSETESRSPPGSARKTYEVTVLMRDGSQKVFRDSGSSVGSSTWRVGERMIVIGGV